MLIQSKYRIDNKRLMDKDGKEKKPWSKLISKNSQQIELVIESKLDKFKAEHEEENQKAVDYIKEKYAQKITNLELKLLQLEKDLCDFEKRFI